MTVSGAPAVPVPPSDPGVTVATGDPGRIVAASTWHSDLADGLDIHAGTISGAAGSLAGAWDGAAANSYQQLSSLVAGHFRTAAGVARGAAATLRRYARELERCQHAGTLARHDAEHWLGEVQRDTITLSHAQDAVRRAQDAVNHARTAMTLAAGAPAAGGAVGAAGRALTAADGELTRAQGAERDARRALEHAQHELTRAQDRGRRAWHEAQQAAEQATGSLAPLTVAPPPLAGAAADPFGPFSPFVGTGPGTGNSGGGLPWEIAAGLTAGGYGTSLIGGASTGISGLASWAGRTLRTGATGAERSAAAPVLRSAGSLGRDLAPIARVAGPAGAVAGLAAGLAGGESPRRAALQTAGSTVGGTVAGGAVGGACEAGTVGLAPPGASSSAPARPRRDHSSAA